MVAGNTLLRLIGLAPDTYFFVILFLLCLAFIAGRLVAISKHLRSINTMFRDGRVTITAGAEEAQPLATPAAAAGSTSRRRSATGRPFPHRRAAKFAARRVAAQ